MRDTTQSEQLRTDDRARRTLKSGNCCLRARSAVMARRRPSCRTCHHRHSTRRGVTERTRRTATNKELITLVAARPLRSPENDHFTPNSPRKWPLESLLVPTLFNT